MVGALFPFLFGGTFIEAAYRRVRKRPAPYFPSFSEGLSLRLPSNHKGSS